MFTGLSYEQLRTATPILNLPSTLDDNLSTDIFFVGLYGKTISLEEWFTLLIQCADCPRTIDLCIQPDSSFHPLAIHCDLPDINFRKCTIKRNPSGSLVACVGTSEFTLHKWYSHLFLAALTTIPTRFSVEVTLPSLM